MSDYQFPESMWQEIEARVASCDRQASNQTLAYLNSGLLRNDLERADVLPDVVDFIEQVLTNHFVKG